MSGWEIEALGTRDQMTDERRPDHNSEEPEHVDDLVDEWGEDSFPASDPPGEVPPDLNRKKDKPRAKGWGRFTVLTKNAHPHVQ